MLKGQIIREYGQTLEVEAAGQVYVCFARKNCDSLVVGDWVDFHYDPPSAQGVIEKRHSRGFVMARSDRYHPVKEMAANITQVLIICAFLPKPNEYYLDQSIIAAELAGLKVLLVINKQDLFNGDPQIATLQAHYEHIGYTVLAISTRTGYQLPQLLKTLVGETTLMVGASGVGKSSLINTLLEKDVSSTQALSTANQKGQHTTSRATLYHLPSGGDLIDIPGIREFQLTQDKKRQLLYGFKEFLPYLGHCRYRNCAHQQDPGCAILEALRTGKISQMRLNHYYRMLEQD